MKKIYLYISAVLFISSSMQAQNNSSFQWGYENRKIIDGKKFRAVSDEVSIDKTVDEVWNEVAGNFMNIDEITTGINFTKCLSGDVISGLGAARLCNLDLGGKTIEIKERIIDFKECGDHREFSYDVYESTGGPVKTYGTWFVRKGEDGKTYLRSTFIFRANFAPLTGLIESQLKKANLITGVLAYKHYLETGEKKVEPKTLLELYPQ